MQLLFKKPDTDAQVTYLYQWDTGVTAEFYLDNDAENVEGVFSTVTMTEGIRKTCTKVDDKWTVQIPDKVLAVGTNIHAFIVFVDSEGRRTVQDCYIPIKKAPKPEGYISKDEPEFISLEELMVALNEAKSDTESARDEAVSASNTATEKANDIEDILNSASSNINSLISAIQQSETAKTGLDASIRKAESLKDELESYEITELAGKVTEIENRLNGLVDGNEVSY